MKLMVFLIQIICFCGFFCFSVLAGQDYYRILGVPRNADEKTIRKAFKKLSIKYHPDKNQGKDQEVAKDKFAEIVNAYEVLTDPEQKKIFDQYGEEGIKGGQGRHQQQQGNFQDIFSQFFGHGGGGGQHFNFNMGGGGGGGGGEQNEDFFSQSDVQKLDMGTITKFYRRREVWVIFFYKSNQRESKNQKDLIRNLAQKYYGIFKVASVNCIEEEELCQEEFSVYDTPSILVFPVNIRQEGKKYTDNMDLQKIVNFAVQQMESFVQIVTDNSYMDFINSQSDNHKILLFTQKKNTPPLYMALSKDLKETIKFGEVRSSNVLLPQKFNIQRYPTLLVVTDPDNYQGIVYEGDLKKDQVMKFIRLNAYINKIGGPKQKKNVNAVRMTQTISQNPDTCGNNDAKLCFIAIVEQKSEAYIMPILNDLATHYQDDPIRIFFVQKSQIAISNIFDEEDIQVDRPSIYLIRGKRQKYLFYNNEVSYNAISMFIDDTLGGNGSFKKLKAGINGNIIGNREEL